MENSDEHFMRLALAEAKKAWGNTAPNPMVGAVLVKDGRVLATGYHHRDGLSHAEIDCLQKVGFRADGCRMYVTLEPCTTHGRTGACSEAIIKAGVKDVVVGCKDVNPAHAGRAARVFAESGVGCTFGVLERECFELNFIFNKNITANTALLAIKYAVTKDGKLTHKRGETAAVSSAQSRADAMKWRRLFQSIGVGMGTLLADNPRLTARLESGVFCPQRLVFDSSLRLAAEQNLSRFNVFFDEFPQLTRIVCDVSASAEAEQTLCSRGIRVMRINAPKTSVQYWAELKKRLFEERICSLYLEGGAEIFKSVCRARAADYVFEYVADKTFGEGLDAFDKPYFSIDAVECATLGGDTFKRGYPVWIQKP